ncbi:hypothetical protein YC2023_021935 [Brassica napus]
MRSVTATSLSPLQSYKMLKPESHPFPVHPTAEWHVVGGGYSSGLLDITITQLGSSSESTQVITSKEIKLTIDTEQNKTPKYLLIVCRAVETSDDAIPDTSDADLHTTPSLIL